MKRFFIFAIMAVAAVTAFAAQPRAEYPRPQFERSEWVNLNGEWTPSPNLKRGHCGILL